MEFEAAVKQISVDLGFDPEVFQWMCDADHIGGYPEKWPMGSCWEVEGKMLYAITRLLRPDTVVELGTYYGCSTAHILQGLYDNGKGILYTVDNGTDPGPEKQRYSPHLVQRRMDGVKFARELRGLQVDLVFEDGPHTTEFTRDVLTYMKQALAPQGIILVHDACHYIVGERVCEGIGQALGEFGKVLAEPSDCGLGYWGDKRDKYSDPTFA